MSDNDISLVICTYNRSKLLRRLLDSLLQLKRCSSWDWEIIIVDNNSNDDTSGVIREYKARLPINALFERRQGKTIALNRAIGVALGELILFLDDDVVVEHAWVDSFARIAAAHPKSYWFGGRVLPEWHNEKPVWLKGESMSMLEGYFGLHDLGRQSRSYGETDKLPIGASMGVRKVVFNRIGGYQEDLGPRGMNRGTADDTELVERARRAGFDGYYVAEAVCRHYISEERLRLTAFLRYGISKGENQYRSDGRYEEIGSYLRVGSQLIRALPQAIYGRSDRVRVCLLNVGLEIGRRRADRSGVTPQLTSV